MVADVVAAEQALFDAGTDPYALMQRAGTLAAQWVWRMAAKRSVSILCGPGNNGGDGLVIARCLQQRGCPVEVIAPLGIRSESARRAQADLTGSIRERGPALGGGCFVDCLFGTGQNRPLGTDLRRLISQMRAAHPISIAVDLPSGVESDRAALLDDIGQYDLTLALGAWKWAHWLMPSRQVMGRRELLDIGLQFDGVVKGRFGGHVVARPHFTPPASDAHKYTRGMVTVIGGKMPGAAVLCAIAAQYGGAGYVKLCAERAPDGLPSTIVHTADPLADTLGDRRSGAVLIGPGLGRGDAAQENLRQTLSSSNTVPLVLDADALNLLDSIQPRQGRPMVLTPHDGELARLRERFVPDVDCTDKRAVACAVARAAGAVVIAKGPDTLIAHPAGELGVAADAPSWLSVAGSGDVLAGLVASRLATGRTPFNAACDAVWLHGRAASRAGAVFTARDLIAALPTAYADCLEPRA